MAQTEQKVVEADGKGQQEITLPKVILCAFGAIVSLFVFLCGLSLMGGAFKVLGGRGASGMFSAVDNPVTGLMTGILSTVLVQSSSTSTSIVVAMAGEGGLTVRQGIPIIMGANIGTSVTNTIVSLGSSGDRIQLERAFSGATVHDMFNMLTVATLLPIEVIIGAMQGEGGPLYWLTYAITEGLMGGEGGNELFDSPVKALTGPVVSEILKANKYVIYALTLDPPEERTPTSVNTAACASDRRLAVASTDDEQAEQAGARSLLSSRRLDDSELPDCSTYFCVGKGLDKQFKKISKKSYKKLTPCDGYILDDGGEPCGSDICYLDAGDYYQEKVADGNLIKGGFLEGAGDIGGGIIGLILSILILCLGLAGLCKCLQIVFLGNAKKIVRYAVRLNDYVAILIGVGITIVVQSSSVTTSALTPLCGIGVLPLAKMLPLTLGANIGTTCTALIASLVSLKFNAVQIALVHLFFNIIGILIWFPIPIMRRVPLTAAKILGLYASYFRWIPVAYLLVAFVCVPAVFLAIGAVISASVAGGIFLLLLVLGGIGFWEYLWVVGYPQGNALCYKILTREQREEGERELDLANAEVMGEAVAAPAEAEV